MSSIFQIASGMSVQDMFDALVSGWESDEPDMVTGDPITIPALIPALREAVFGGMESTGGSGGFQAKMPIDPGALDLYQAIDREVAEAWAAAFPGEIPTADQLEALLSQFVAVTAPTARTEVIAITVGIQRIENVGSRDERWWVEWERQEFTPQELMKRWMTQIQAFFDPPRMREILAPCVACGVEFAWRNDSGEHKPYRVLVFVHDAEGNTREARCLRCGVSWGRDQFQYLAAAIRSHEESAATYENAGG